MIRHACRCDRRARAASTSQRRTPDRTSRMSLCREAATVNSRDVERSETPGRPFLARRHRAAVPAHPRVAPNRAPREMLRAPSALLRAPFASDGARKPANGAPSATDGAPSAMHGAPFVINGAPMSANRARKTMLGGAIPEKMAATAQVTGNLHRCTVQCSAFAPSPGVSLRSTPRLLTPAASRHVPAACSPFSALRSPSLHFFTSPVC